MNWKLRFSQGLFFLVLLVVLFRPDPQMKVMGKYTPEFYLRVIAESVATLEAGK